MSPPRVRPLAGALGAEILDLNLSASLDGATWEALETAFHTYSVVFFRDQKLTREAQLEFARRFGEPEVHPIANSMAEHPEIIEVRKPKGEQAFFGTSWHTDNSFFERPSGTTVLYGATVPPAGGDTVFASTERAYATLSEPLRRFLDPLRAVHTAADAYDPRTTGDAKYRGETAITYTFTDTIYDRVEHPIVRTHPATGRKGLYVNPMFTERIVGLEKHESDALLQMLFAHATRQEFTCRFRWEAGSVAVWDNRCVQHYAIDDYADYERVMYRVTLQGERPV